MKVCRICGVEKDESEFHKSKKYKDGLNTMCKECRNKQARAYYYKHKIKSLEKKDSASKEFTKEFGNVCCDKVIDRNITKEYRESITDTKVCDFLSLCVFLYGKLVLFCEHIFDVLFAVKNKIRYILFNN